MSILIWDKGTYEVLGNNPKKNLEKGKLHFSLNGEKLKGEWHLVRFRGEGKQWLFIKGGESMRPVSKKADNLSVLSGKTMGQLAKGDRVWQSNETHKVGTKRKGRKAAFLPKFVEPMKAKLLAEPLVGDWMYEIKFDGWRALALKGGSQSRLFSRNEKDLGAKFPEIMESLADLDVQDAIIDGEIVALDEKGRSSFQLLQAYDMNQKRPPIYFYLFDLLQLNGKDLTDEPIEKRKTALKKLLSKHKGILRFSDDLGADAKTLLKHVEKLNLEGLIGKRKASRYEVGARSGAWIKLKITKEQEFVIGGYTDPEGSRMHFGALIVGYYKGKELLFAGKVGTGFNAKLLRSLHTDFKKISQKKCPFVNLPVSHSGKWGQGISKSEMQFCHWLKPKMVAQIKFQEWTTDNKLRQPVFLGLRNDKDADDVIREMAK